MSTEAKTIGASSSAEEDPPGLLRRLKARLRHRFGYSRKPQFLLRACERSALRLMHRSASQALFQIPKLRTLEQSRVLFIAPHMDDEAIGAGGAIELLRRERSDMALLFTADCAGTSADPVRNAELAHIRNAEAENAARKMQMEFLGHLGFPTGALSRHERGMGRELARHLEAWKPETIFAPYPTDGHRDHQATAAGVALALRRCGWKGEVWAYEVWSPMFPNAAVDISSAARAKRDFIECYPSQLEDVHYAEGSLGLNRLRGQAVGVDLAEAFYVTNAGGYSSLADCLIG